MHLCLDIDDTITYAPDFFVSICNFFAEAEISIVTFRSELESTHAYLTEIGLRFDRLIVSTDPVDGKQENESLPQWKSRLVNRLKPNIFFEDMPEVVALIDDQITVFMPCDPVIRSWIKSSLASPDLGE